MAVRARASPVKLSPFVVLRAVSIKHRAYIYPRYLSPRYDRSDNLFRLSHPPPPAREDPRSPRPATDPELASATPKHPVENDFFFPLLFPSPFSFLSFPIPPFLLLLHLLLSPFSRGSHPSLLKSSITVSIRRRRRRRHRVKKGEKKEKNECHAPIKQAISRCPGAKRGPRVIPRGVLTTPPRCASQGILLPDHRACIALRG